MYFFLSHASCPFWSSSIFISVKVCADGKEVRETKDGEQEAKKYVVD